MKRRGAFSETGGRKKTRPETVGGLVSRVLDDLGLGETARVMKVLGCWAAAVGPEVASHCQPTALRGDVLEATADSSVWCQQLQLRAPEILAGLHRELGPEAPRELRLKVG